MTKKRIRIRGNDRALMFICRDIRRRWQQYGENKLWDLKKKKTKCSTCSARATQWDHIDPVGKRAYSWDEIGEYAKRMFLVKCQPMCSKCNRKKGAKK